MIQPKPPNSGAWIHRSARESRGAASAGFLPAVLLHGTGAAGFDEILIFGGIGLVIAVLVYLSWRSGKKTKRERSKRKRSR